MERLGSDATLAGELPSTIEVHRIAEPEPPPATVSRARLSGGCGSSGLAAMVGGGRRRPGRPPARSDVIFATMSPFESAEVAAPVAARLGVPWVADLRDPVGARRDARLAHRASTARASGGGCAASSRRPTPS